MTRHCILEIIDQYSYAHGNCDIEHFVCKITTGKTITLHDDDPDIEEFIDNKETYWQNKGWNVNRKDDRYIITPKEKSIKGWKPRNCNKFFHF